MVRARAHSLSWDPKDSTLFPPRLSRKSKVRRVPMPRDGWKGHGRLKPTDKGEGEGEQEEAIGKMFSANLHRMSSENKGLKSQA